MTLDTTPKLVSEEPYSAHHPVLIESEQPSVDTSMDITHRSALSERPGYADIRRLLSGSSPPETPVGYKVRDQKLFATWMGFGSSSDQQFDLQVRPHNEITVEKSLQRKFIPDPPTRLSIPCPRQRIYHKSLLYSPLVDPDTFSNQILQKRDQFVPIYKKGSPHFRNLAAEIRLLIWSMVIQTPRVIRLYGDEETGQFRSTTCVPAVLHVNQESRTEALKTYVLWGAAYMSYDHIMGHNQTSEAALVGQIYLNYEVDILDVTYALPSTPNSNFARLLNITQPDRMKVKRMAAEGDSGFWKKEQTLIGGVFTKQFPNVQEFLVTAPGFVLDHGEWGAWDLEYGVLEWQKFNWGSDSTLVPSSWKALMEDIRMSSKETLTSDDMELTIVIGGIWKGGEDSSLENESLTTWVNNFYAYNQGN